MLVYTARWLLPVSAPPVRDGAVVVDRDGRLAYVGPAAGAPRGERVALGDAAITPGLGAADVPPIGPTSPAYGVATCAVIPSSAPALERVFDGIVNAGMRATLYVPFSGALPARRAAGLDDLQRRVAALRARVADAHAVDRVRVGVTPRDFPAVDEDLLLDACAWAVGDSLPIAIPAGRSSAEVLYLREASGPYADAGRGAGLDVVRRAHSAVHLLAELGIAAVARPLLVGGSLFDASDVALAAYYDCPVAYVRPLAGEPEFPPPLDGPVAALLDAGARVALADASDLLATAARLAGSADDALHLATLGAARALDLGDETGSLDVGKSADLCAFPFSAADLALAEARGPAHALLARPARAAALTLVAGRALGEAPPSRLFHPV